MRKIFLLVLGALLSSLAMAQEKAEKVVNTDSIQRVLLDSLRSTQTEEDYGEVPVMKVMKKAEFPGGMKELQAFLSNNLVYPKEAISAGIEGRVIVFFVVGRDGSIRDIEVKRASHPLLDAEAVRVVKSMPRWKPAENNGKPVASYYTLPISFYFSR